MKQKLAQMLSIQNETNQHVDPNWQKNQWDFLLAARMEAAEAIDHIGYKWWSAKKEPDIAQAKMELVDIWHFLLSHVLVQSAKDSSYEQHFFNQVKKDINQTGSMNDAIQCLQSLLTTNDAQLGTDFALACNALGLTFEELYKLFIGKAALNRFRWAHQYGKDYKKIWNDGREDNEHLADILKTLTIEQVGLENIQSLLHEAYTANN